MGVKRVYVEKKPEFAVQAKELRHEVKSYLGIKTVKNVRVLIHYDVENLSDATFERACNGVFAEPPVDVLYREDFPREESDHIFSVEFLPGQFDQRADSAVQCVQFIKEDELPVIKTATTYVKVRSAKKRWKLSRRTALTRWIPERQDLKNRRHWLRNSRNLQM